VFLGASMQAIAEILALPKYWHGSGSLAPSVLRSLADLPPAEYSVETGTGKSTLLFSRLSRHHVVFTVEDEGGPLRRVQQSPLLNKENVEFVLGPTQHTLPVFLFSHPIDFALIDGPHGYPFPELEYYYFYPHIKSGGWLIIDDCHIPTVARLVDFLKADKMWRFITTVQTTAFFKRTDAELFSPVADGWWLQGFNKKLPALRHCSPSVWPRLLIPEWLKAIFRSYCSQQAMPG
jgi:Methyltransferase domain